MSIREEFEAAVIKRMKESGFLEVEIRVECLGRSGDGYSDGSIDAYWHFWQESRAALVIELPALKNSTSYYDGGDQHDDLVNKIRKSVEAAGVKVKP